MLDWWEGTFRGQNEGWEGERPTKGQTIEELFSRAKSGKNFFVLLVRKFLFNG